MVWSRLRAIRYTLSGDDTVGSQKSPAREGTMISVYIHGNCQSYVIAKLLEGTCPDWLISFFEVHADPIMERHSEYRELIRTADIIVSQPIHDNYRNVEDLALSWIRAEAKRSCEIVVIPSAHFSGHHPEWANLGSLGDLCNNSIAAHLAMVGTDPNALIPMMLSPELLDDHVIQKEIDLQIEEMHFRETHDKHDVSISDVIEQYASWIQMFHIVNHPTRPIYVHIINRLLQRLGRPERIPMDGVDLQPVPHLPMAPAIARYCDTRSLVRPDWSPVVESDVLMPGREPTPASVYFAEMTKQLQQHQAEVIADAIRADWRSLFFLRRLAAAGVNLPRIDIWDAE